MGHFEKLEFELKKFSNSIPRFIFFAYFYTWSTITFYRVIYPIRNSVTFCCSWRISRSFWKIKRDFNWKNFILLFLFTFTYNIIPCPFLSLVTCDILKKKYINFKENYFVINILINGNNIIIVNENRIRSIIVFTSSLNKFIL